VAAHQSHNIEGFNDMKHMLIVALAAMVLVACASQQQTRMTAGGAAVGAATGAAIGSQNNRTGEGALIGGALGAAAGMILGAPGNTPQAQQPQYQEPTYQQPRQVNHRREHRKDRKDRKDD